MHCFRAGANRCKLRTGPFLSGQTGTILAQAMRVRSGERQFSDKDG
jgi:hypothetical protein